MGPGPADACEVPGYVFIRGWQPASWRGVLSCEPLVDPRAKCDADARCVAFTAVKSAAATAGWTYGAPAAVECVPGGGLGRRLFGLLAGAAAPPAPAPAVRDARDGAPFPGFGAGGRRPTWEWGWAPLECANGTACCGTFVVRDRGAAAAYDLRCLDTAEAGPPHDNYFAPQDEGHQCRCPAMDKTYPYSSTQAFKSECWRQLGFCGATRYSPCRLASPSAGLAHASEAACAAVGRAAAGSCAVVKRAAAGLKAAREGTERPAPACAGPGKCGDACSLC
jgi:hypothetical protein